MSWNGKSYHKQPTFTINWHDYVPDEKIEEFEDKLYPEVKALIEKRFAEEFEKEIAEGNVELFVN